MHFDETNTFCITLKNSTRWDRMIGRFEEFGMKVQRWEASTPDTVADCFAPGLSPRQKACAQSHVNVWKHIVSSQLSYALVLEDDAMFRKDWLQILETIRSVLDADHEWDAVFLNASEPTTMLEQWVPARDQVLAAGYILSLRGATKLLNRWNHEFFTSDWMTCCLQRDGHSYTYFPWLIIQEGNDTTIGSNVDADHAKVVRCLNEVGYSLSNYV